ncbi:unnamed protein product [Malus baccata var. baccata]
MLTQKKSGGSLIGVGSESLLLQKSSTNLIPKTKCDIWVNYANGLMKLVEVENLIGQMANQGVELNPQQKRKNLIEEGLTTFLKLKFGFVGESIKGKGKSVKGKGKVKTAPKKATKKVSVTCVELERAFKECEDEDDVLNMGLVYFPEAVLIEVKSNVGVNLEYLDLVEDKDRFNTYS